MLQSPRCMNRAPIPSREIIPLTNATGPPCSVCGGLWVTLIGRNPAKKRKEKIDGHHQAHISIHLIIHHMLFIINHQLSVIIQFIQAFNHPVTFFFLFPFVLFSFPSVQLTNNYNCIHIIIQQKYMYKFIYIPMLSYYEDAKKGYQQIGSNQNNN